MWSTLPHHTSNFFLWKYEDIVFLQNIESTIYTVNDYIKLYQIWFNVPLIQFSYKRYRMNTLSISNMSFKLSVWQNKLKLFNCVRLQVSYDIYSYYIWFWYITCLSILFSNKSTVTKITIYDKIEGEAAGWVV